MREDIYRVVRNLADLDNSKQLTPEQAEEFTSFIVDTVISKVLHTVRSTVDSFDFAVYDHPYFADVPSGTVGDDLATLLIDEIESL